MSNSLLIQDDAMESVTARASDTESFLESQEQNIETSTTSRYGAKVVSVALSLSLLLVGTVLVPSAWSLKLGHQHHLRRPHIVQLEKASSLIAAESSQGGDMDFHSRSFQSIVLFTTTARGTDTNASQEHHLVQGGAYEGYEAPSYQHISPLSEDLGDQERRGDTTVTLTTTTTTTLLKALYCWAVMQPHGYEKDLLSQALAQGVSLFDCDYSTVFSDGAIPLRPPLRISTVDIGNTSCEFGGHWGLALNTPVFVKAWVRIFSTGYYKHYSWTVKVDPDTVFIPSRLRQHIKHLDPSDTTYLNNCDQGMHGPIEVVALGAMKVFDKGLSQCIDKLRKEFTWEGEDVFVRHCLNLLNVKRIDDFHLLSEDRCLGEDPAKTGCISGKVSFHPFKDPETYFKCLDEATSSSWAEALE